MKAAESLRRYSFATLLILLLTLITGCSAIDNAVEKVARDVERNLLTGLPGANRQILGVKIDDTNAAQPQVGVESADVVYIEQVEAGLTRLLALYSSQYPIRIGPVRSARISDIDILAEYGRVGLIFSGAQSRLYPYLDAANIANLGAQRNPPTVYVRDSLRNSPTNMFVYPDKLLEVDKNASSIDLVRKPGWSFGENPGTGVEIESATVRWPKATYRVDWSSDEDRWLISFNGKPKVNPDGYQLGSPNFVIQIVAIVPSDFGDRYGGVTPKSEVVGSGKGFLLRDGFAIEVSWRRDSPETPTTWQLVDGSPAPFEPGQIWIALTANEPSFGYPEATVGDNQK
ncbi:MAG: DUF3048 domain-containing protein [Actinomycetota bacterium]